jgi:hypothetical protein
MTEPLGTARTPTSRAHDGVISFEVSDRDRTVRIWRRGLDGATSTTEEPYTAFFTTSSEAAAAHLRAAGHRVEELAGDGPQRFRVRSAGTSRADALAVLYRDLGLQRDDPALRVEPPHAAYLLDHGGGLLVGVPDDAVRLLFLDVCIGWTLPTTEPLDGFDPDCRVRTLVAWMPGQPPVHHVVTSDREALAWLTDTVIELDPDVIIGEELNARIAFLARRAESLGGVLTLARNWLSMASMRDGRLRAPGRTILDAEPLLDSPVARPLGPAAIASSLPEALLLDARHRVQALHRATHANLRALFAVVRAVPGTLQEAARPTLSWLFDRAFVLAYHQADHALPTPPDDPLPLGNPAYIETRAEGRFEHVAYLDVRSLYPTLIAELELCPRHDSLRAFANLVRRLLARRDAAKGLGRDAEASALKRVLVSAFGMTGAAHARVLDRRLTRTIITTGRRVAEAMVDAAEAMGGLILKVETDGLLVQLPLGISAEELRAAVERAAQHAIGVPVLTVRLEGLYDVALISPSVKLLRGGARKGLPRAAPPTFFRAVRDDVIEALFVGDLDGADTRIARALDELKQGNFDPLSVAVDVRVEKAPCACDGLSPTQAAAATAPDVVAHDVVPLVLLSGTGREPERWHVATESPASIDPRWVRALLRNALAPLGAFIDLDAHFRGTPPQPRAPRVRARGGSVLTELVAGLKTAGSRTHARVIEVEDDASRDEFRCAHGDVHELLLAFRGETDDAPALAHRLRRGSFAMEFESKRDPALALRAAQTALGVLTEWGADPDRDIRVIYNGAESIVLRARQGALGVRDSIDLPQLYERFAQHLGHAVADRLSVDDARAFYDAELYGPRSTYRMEGVTHERTGRVCSAVPYDRLLAAGQHDELDGPEWSRAAAFEEGPAVLREPFDDATLGMPRREAYDPSTVEKRRDTLARRDARLRSQKLRLAVLGNDDIAPCASAALRLAECGESLGYALFAKATYELRAAGWSREEIAERIASGAGGLHRYEGRIVVSGTTPNLRHDLWPEDPERSYHRGCSGHARIRDVCRFEECYRSGLVHTFDDGASPTFDDARSQAYAATAAAVTVPPRPGIAAVEVPPRSGKTTALTRQALAGVAEGARVFIAAPTHAVAETALDYLLSQRGASAATILHLLGRSDATCRRPERTSCAGCPDDLTVNGPLRELNPRLRTLRMPKFANRHWLSAEADRRDLCIRTVSRKLGRAASLVVGVHAHLGLDQFEDMTGAFDVILVDEADQLVDTLVTTTRTLTLAASRQERSGVVRQCDMTCDACHLAFADHPSLEGWRGRVKVADARAQSSPRTLLDHLDRALSLAEQDPTLMPDVDVRALRRFAGTLAGALPDPEDVARGEHVSPRRYGASLHEYARGDGVEPGRTRDSDATPIRLAASPCIGEAARVEQEDPKRRHVLLAPHADECSSEDQQALKSLADLAEVVDLGGRGSGYTLLTPQIKPGPWASFHNRCDLTMLAHDARLQRNVARRLCGARTLLVSATMSSPETLQGVLGVEVEIQRMTVPLHRDLTVFLHRTAHQPRSAPSVPRRMNERDVVQLVRRVMDLVKTREPRRSLLRILVFAHNKERCNELPLPFLDAGMPCMLHKHVAGRIEPGQVALDYLRSPTARGIDADADLIVVFGSGLPRYEAFHAFAEHLAERQDASVELLAGLSRVQSVVQAMFRSASLPGRRVVLLVNDMHTGDLPESAHHRVLLGSELYQSLGLSADACAEQRELLAAAIAEALVERGGLPSLDEIAKFGGDGGSVGGRREESNLRMFARILSCEGGLTAGKHQGSRENWQAMLPWLCSRGVLEQTASPKGRQGNRQLTYRVCEGVREHYRRLDPPYESCIGSRTESRSEGP